MPTLQRFRNQYRSRISFRAISRHEYLYVSLKYLGTILSKYEFFKIETFTNLRKKMRLLFILYSANFFLLNWKLIGAIEEIKLFTKQICNTIIMLEILNLSRLKAISM